MSQGISITTALCLSEKDNAALVTGRSIAVLSRTFNTPGKCFALYPDDESKIVTAWAELKSCKIYDDPKVAEALSWHTVFPKQFLQKLIEEKQKIFLNILRVHQLVSPVILDKIKIEDRIGSFVRLPVVLSTNTDQPVLSSFTFNDRYHRLEQLKAPEHPELEALQSAIAPYSKEFDDDIQRFLGWKIETPKQSSLPDWIKQISVLGHRGEETEKNKKSHYQAGTDFEISVRNSFKYLGFTIDESHQGKAGGIDAFCAAPYSIAIECKSGKSIPDNTVEELARIAKRHLKDNYQSAIKLIIGPGNPTKQLSESATISEINIMQPETLQRLVELQTVHPGALDLLELEPCLRREPFGTESDKKVNDFIDQIEKKIKIRSYVIQSVKSLKEGGDSLVSASTVRIHFNVAFAPTLQESLDTPEQAHSILIELSSPLTGYLGRTKCDTWRGDRFYFLRDLRVE
jgi:Domain of unknown function (DUF1802)